MHIQMTDSQSLPRELIIVRCAVGLANWRDRLSTLGIYSWSRNRELGSIRVIGDNDDVKTEARLLKQVIMVIEAKLKEDVHKYWVYAQKKMAHLTGGYCDFIKEGKMALRIEKLILKITL